MSRKPAIIIITKKYLVFIPGKASKAAMKMRENELWICLFASVDCTRQYENFKLVSTDKTTL